MPALFSFLVLWNYADALSRGTDQEHVISFGQEKSLTNACSQLKR